LEIDTVLSSHIAIGFWLCPVFVMIACLPYSLRVADASWYWRCTLPGMCLGSPTTLMINRTRLAGTKKKACLHEDYLCRKCPPEASRDFYSFEAIVPVHFAISSCTTETAVARNGFRKALRTDYRSDVGRALVLS
jgi:hypothetical protein